MSECRTSYSCPGVTTPALTVVGYKSPHSYFPSKPTHRPLYQNRTWSLSFLRSLQSVSQQGWQLWYPFWGLTVLLWVDVREKKYSKLMHGSSPSQRLPAVLLSLVRVSHTGTLDAGKHALNKTSGNGHTNVLST